jgi:hypothetical protein
MFDQAGSFDFGIARVHYKGTATSTRQANAFGLNGNIGIGGHFPSRSSTHDCQVVFLERWYGLPDREFMRALRQAWGAGIGVPAAPWMLK